MAGKLHPYIAALGILAAISLLLQRGDAEIIYAEEGSFPELPCPCSSCFKERGKVSWFFAQKDNTVTLFEKRMNDHITRLRAAGSRLNMLQNYSLQFSNVTGEDSGRYWCDAHYYDLVVVTGTKRKLESDRADTACFVLSCSFPSKEQLDRNVVRWWDGDTQVQKEEKEGAYVLFRGPKSSQLLICLKKGKGTKEKRIKCCIAEKMNITFSLPGDEAATEHLSPLCPESRKNGIPWIPLAVAVAVQFAIICALGVALWRRRCRQKHSSHLTKPRKEFSQLECTQVYENIKTGRETL